MNLYFVEFGRDPLGSNLGVDEKTMYVVANDIVSAAAISTGTTWDASIPIVCIPVTATLSTWLHTTADSEITATVAVEVLTAGKLVLFVEWLYWGDLALT